MLFSHSGAKPCLTISVPSPEDKGKRKEIHEVIKKHLSIFESETVIFSNNLRKNFF